MHPPELNSGSVLVGRGCNANFVGLFYGICFFYKNMYTLIDPASFSGWRKFSINWPTPELNKYGGVLRWPYNLTFITFACSAQWRKLSADPLYKGIAFSSGRGGCSAPPSSEYRHLWSQQLGSETH